MVTDENAAAIRQLRREVAELRGLLSVLKSALNLAPDETWGSMAGRLRRQGDDTRELAQQAMGNISVLFENTVISQSGRDWQPLAMPPGAVGTADYRPASDGSLALRFALAWRSAPPGGTVALAGVPRELWAAAPWSDGRVSLALNGEVTLMVSGARFSASVLVPVR